jgi:hypothetical protein
MLSCLLRILDDFQSRQLHHTFPHQVRTPVPNTHILTTTRELYSSLLINMSTQILHEDDAIVHRHSGEEMPPVSSVNHYSFLVDDGTNQPCSSVKNPSGHPIFALKAVS